MDERLERFMSRQAAISEAKLAGKIGKTLEVLVDEVGPDGVVGRSYADAPEIDGRVILKGGAKLKAGQRVMATVTAADTHDLYATVVKG